MKVDTHGGQGSILAGPRLALPGGAGDSQVLTEGALPPAVNPEGEEGTPHPAALVRPGALTGPQF